LKLSHHPAFFNVWYPSVTPGTNDHSLAEIWVLAGGNGVVQSAETGWSVAPDTFGTTDAVLFTYWTADDYNKTGCYDLTCPGFIQTSNIAVLGTPYWSGPSQPGNPNYTLIWLS
jgi:Neprosin